MAELVNSLVAMLMIKLAKWLGFSAQEFNALIEEAISSSKGKSKDG